jgi:hypothetical protein
MPNTSVRAAAEGMPAVINRRTILTGIGAVAIAAVTSRKTESDGLDEAGSSIGKESHMNMINHEHFRAQVDADAIQATGKKDSLDAMLLQLPPAEAERLRVEFMALIGAVREMSARGEDRQSIRDFIRTRLQQNQMDWKRSRQI